MKRGIVKKKSALFINAFIMSIFDKQKCTPLFRNLCVNLKIVSKYGHMYRSFVSQNVQVVLKNRHSVIKSVTQYLKNRFTLKSNPDLNLIKINFLMYTPSTDFNTIRIGPLLKYNNIIAHIKLHERRPFSFRITSGLLA